MCSGVKYTYKHQDWTVYFPNPKAALPVRLKSGEMALIRWGRRKEEPGDLPGGGWVRQDSLQKGIWDKYFPKNVGIFVDAFMEKDRWGQSHWYPIIRGKAIHGIVTRLGKEQRVYVVTAEPENKSFRRWPKVIFAGGISPT